MSKGLAGLLGALAGILARDDKPLGTPEEEETRVYEYIDKTMVAARRTPMAELVGMYTATDDEGMAKLVDNCVEGFHEMFPHHRGMIAVSGELMSMPIDLQRIFSAMKDEDEKLAASAPQVVTRVGRKLFTLGYDRVIFTACNHIPALGHVRCGFMYGKDFDYLMGVMITDHGMTIAGIPNMLDNLDQPLN